MSVIKINDMKDRIEELVTRVQAGETILIEKDGETVARLVAIASVPAPEEGPNSGQFDWEALKKFTDSQAMQTEPAGDFLRRMRDESRY